jgi:hypothetical protein
MVDDYAIRAGSVGSENTHPDDASALDNCGNRLPRLPLSRPQTPTARRVGKYFEPQYAA